MAACFLLVGTAVLSAAGLACRFGWVTELARVQVCQAPVLHENRAEDIWVPVVVAGPAEHFLTLPNNF